MFVGGVVAVAGILLIALVVVVWKYQTIASQLQALNDPQAIAKKQALEVAAQVGKLIVVPDEVPTLATVTDATALPKQEFFAKAADGDQVLLYTQAKKVYLYRPSTKQLIDVAALTLQTRDAVSQTSTALQGQAQVAPQAQDAAAAASPTPELVTLALYNGTTTTGLTSKFEAKLKAAAITTPVTVKTNATASTYQKSLIIDVNGTQAQKVTELATQLSLEKSTLPEGEDKPNADILIILGSDVVAVQ